MAWPASEAAADVTADRAEAAIAIVAEVADETAMIAVDAVDAVDVMTAVTAVTAVAHEIVTSVPASKPLRPPSASPRHRCRTRICTRKGLRRASVWASATRRPSVAPSGLLNPHAVRIRHPSRNRPRARPRTPVRALARDSSGLLVLLS